MQKIETGISELLKRQPVTEQEKDAYIQDLQKALRLLLEEVRDLEEMVALLQKKQFGSSSEATPVQEEEEPLGVFPEAELEYKEDACKNRHPSPICTRFEHHLAGGLAPLSRTEAPRPYNWFSTAKL